MAGEALRPGIRLGIYPHRLDEATSKFERIGRYYSASLSATLRWKYAFHRVVDKVDQAAEGMAQWDDAALAQNLEELRYILLRDGLRAAPVLRAFALVREYAWRTLRMRHYDVQLYGAWVMINGDLAEMATGEGKSFTATLAAATAALAGIPVHVITTNEYLAARDAQQMLPLYDALGLSVAAVSDGMNSAQRRASYRCDIAYCTNKQVAFDYLRDRLLMRNESGLMSLKFSRNKYSQQLLLRGLCYAIVDEADSLLIDEASTPLVLSREHDDEVQHSIVEQALAFARSMREAEHFHLLARERSVEITAEGLTWLASRTESLEGIWSGRRHAEFLTHQALCAIHLFEKDIHYLVRNGKVEIIDRNTGRTMADHAWRRGLHQMIECKEGCAMTGYRETLASISYQRFFRRYMLLGGMSGTLRQVAGELRGVYQQRVVAVPTHRPVKRRDLAFRVYPRSEDKWKAVVERVEAVHATGQPVLIGTASVGDSEWLAGIMKQHGFVCRVLNARQDQEEAQIIAQAGQLGNITIATNMAGRGTDIELGRGVAELGGLHIVVTDCHEEARVDRQLRGRCARQGDPGSTETRLSLNDNLFRNFYPLRVRRLLGSLALPEGRLAVLLNRCLVGFAQWRMSRQYRADRRMVMQRDERLGKVLAYSGDQE